jgi:hypothetical protein
MLCALKSSSFPAQQGGPMGDAPAYDCKRTASATLDGATFTFKVAGLVSEGMVAVAVLPGDASTRAVLAKPSESSLRLASGASAVGTTVPVSDAGSGTTSGTGAAAPAALAGLTGAAAAPASADAGVVPPAQVAGTGQHPAVAAAAPATSLTATTPVAATRSTGALRRVLLVLLVAALASAGVAWAFVGSGPVLEDATA